MIQMNNVSYRYKSMAGDIAAVKQATAVFEKGMSYAIVGRSGSGKSTLLSLIAGLDIPSEGQILFNGIDLNTVDRNEFRRNNVGIIYQSFYLIPHLTVLENVEMSLEISGWNGDIKERAKEMVRKVGLNDIHMKKRANQISGGEQQRVAIARALANNPGLLLADEPTGNLDNENSKNIVNLIKSAVDDNTCVIIITHSMEIAKNMDRIYEMNDGFIRTNN